MSSKGGAHEHKDADEEIATKHVGMTGGKMNHVFVPDAGTYAGGLAFTNERAERAFLTGVPTLKTDGACCALFLREAAEAKEASDDGGREWIFCERRDTRGKPFPAGPLVVT